MAKPDRLDAAIKALADVGYNATRCRCARRHRCPQGLTDRYGAAMKPVWDFVHRFHSLSNSNDNAWFFSHKSYAGADGITYPTGFTYDWYERWEDDECGYDAGVVRRLWDRFIPVALSVHSDYVALGVSVDTGEVYEIEHADESPALRAPSVLALLESLAEAVRTSDGAGHLGYFFAIPHKERTRRKRG